VNRDIPAGERTLAGVSISRSNPDGLGDASSAASARENALETGTPKKRIEPDSPALWVGPMNDITSYEQSVELLQQLGLKEYESKCFVALSRVPKATAKEISEISEVPRTRVYDAIRVLEARGLVEIQHSSPQQYRAVKIEEAAATLREEFASRAAELADTLRDVEAVTLNDEEEVTHEVWALSGETVISNRTESLLEDAEDEVVLIVGDERKLTDSLLESLASAQDRGVNLVIGAVTEELSERVRSEIPDAEVFVSELEWLTRLGGDPVDTVSITQLLLVDRSALLTSTAQQGHDGPGPDEKAVFGRGFTNGLVVIARRLMATGLQRTSDPGVSDQ
jgi:sugar-specific transcriptional regulator TrmB